MADGDESGLKDSNGHDNNKVTRGKWDLKKIVQTNCSVGFSIFCESNNTVIFWQHIFWCVHEFDGIISKF